tara:strand:- start:449 stop:691 length:243 start_codon:yes stop_codon:yes gene_type:complete
MIRPTSSLVDLRSGDEGVVTSVPGSSPLVARLGELGLVPGAYIRILRDVCPLVFQVGEDRLSIRKRDAAAIRVQRDTTES